MANKQQGNAPNTSKGEAGLNTLLLPGVGPILGPALSEPPPPPPPPTPAPQSSKYKPPATPAPAVVEQPAPAPVVAEQPAPASAPPTNTPNGKYRPPPPPPPTTNPFPAGQPISRENLTEENLRNYVAYKAHNPGTLPEHLNTQLEQNRMRFQEKYNNNDFSPVSSTSPAKSKQKRQSPSQGPLPLYSASERVGFINPQYSSYNSGTLSPKVSGGNLGPIG